MELLEQYYVPVVAAICIAVHYIAKRLLTAKEVQRFMPLIMGMIGIGINAWMHMSFTPDIVLGGLASGLASTGLFEMIKGMKKEKVVISPGSEVALNDEVVVACCKDEKLDADPDLAAKQSVLPIKEKAQSVPAEGEDTGLKPTAATEETKNTKTEDETTAQTANESEAVSASSPKEK